jgi:hypothetical protein
VLNLHIKKRSGIPYREFMNLYITCKGKQWMFPDKLSKLIVFGFLSPANIGWGKDEKMNFSAPLNGAQNTAGGSS